MMKRNLLILLSLLLPFGLIKAQTAGENIDVTHYEIHVGDFNFTNHTLTGYAYVDVTTTAPTDTFVLELKSLTATYVSSNGYSVNHFEQEGDLLVVVLDTPAPAGSAMTLYIDYGGSTFSETWGGVEWWGDYVYNLGVGFDSQPHNLGKTWFPCVDNFTDKATYDVFVTTTNDKKAICGGNFVETIDNGDGTSTWHWNTPQEIATYHISFAVGNYEVWEDVYHGIERDIPVQVYAKPDQIHLVSGTFVHVKEITAFFEECIGPYPFNRIGYVSTGKGCMEHTDNIAFASSIINGNTSGEEYVAHELSHMWSGNKVTCSTAGDMWLNEGFAQFWGCFYRAGVYGEDNFIEAMASMVNSIASWCNSPNHWMPLNNMPLNMTYDGDAVYDRGAVIVNTMMNYMGRENFLAAMRAYFEQYAYGASNSEELRDALTAYSGIDMNGFFDTYIFASGMPHLYVCIESVTPMDGQYQVGLKMRYQHIGDTHIGKHNIYPVTFIGPDFQLATDTVCWDGLTGHTVKTLDFEPVALVNDFDNGILDGKTQKQQMLKSGSLSFANFKAEAVNIADSVFLNIENHLAGPYDDPLIPALTLSTKHFWSIERHDFGEAEVNGIFTYTVSNDNDIIHTENDSATLVYRRNASEPWHEIAYTLHPQSFWRLGQITVHDLQSGEYAIAVWDKEHIGTTEHFEEQGMQVFPNPAESQVHISWATPVKGQLVVTDQYGKKLKAITATEQSITLSVDGWAKGLYFIEHIDQNGTVLEREKLIIK